MNEQTKWKWILAATSEEEWIFLHPVNNEHRVCVRASPSEVPSLLIQPELISLEYKKQHQISGILGAGRRLMQHWLRIYSYLQPSFPQRIGMRRLCRLFNAVERLTTENPNCSTLMLMPIPSGVWSTFPNVNHVSLESLVEWVNEVMEASPDSAPRLLFLQEGAPDVVHDYRSWYGPDDKGDTSYRILNPTCVVVDETGCFHLTGDNVTDDDVVRVAREHPNLQSLNLAFCSNITDTSLSEVASECSNLQSLNLEGCRNITDVGLAALSLCLKLDPLRILVKKRELTLEGIRQFFIAVEREEWKLDTLHDLFETLAMTQTIIYCNTSQKVDWLAEQMTSCDFVVSAMHGDMNHRERDLIIREFRSGSSRVLITTDLLACGGIRGIYVPQVSLVINYDIPATNDPNTENYIQRIGRSAFIRIFANRRVAINFVTLSDTQCLRDIEQFYGTQIVELSMDVVDLL